MAKPTLTAAAAALAGVTLAGMAEAGLEICNDSGVFQSVAVGYMGDEDWTSEGWWLVEPGGCATVLEDDLEHRYYYYRALADGESFEGGGYSFCTDPGAFTIVGDTDCEARGYETSDFREIDTGETALHHVERIPASAVPMPPMTDEDVSGLDHDEDAGLEEEDEDAGLADELFEEEFGDGMPDPRRGSSRL
jgi:uncharacterized membrane protein